MLNVLEEKVLKYLIDQNIDSVVDVSQIGDTLQESCEAVMSLEKKGLVLCCNTLSSAAAILKQEGKYYFATEKKQKKIEKNRIVIEWVRYGITTLIAIAALVVSICK